MSSNAPLVRFRVLFGLLMLVESWGAIATGWVASTFVTPRVTFPLIGFEWLRFLSGHWMVGYFFVMGLAAVGVMVGYRYRASAAVLALMWTGAYLAQKSHYNNHYYLAALVAWGMAMVPAHRARSFDVRAGRAAETTVCHPWVHRAFRLQLLIVFTYAALAKLYPGWLEGDYLAANLGGKGDRWPLGGLVVQPWFQSFTAYAAIAFDGLVIPALMWRRTRLLALAGMVVFNLFNSVVFRIGIFPYMVLAMCVFFFEDRSGCNERGGAALRPGVKLALFAYFALQVALPLRHHAIPGDVTWTEEGHRMSWRMMLRTKSGTLVLRARDASSGRAWVVPQREFLSERQLARTAVQPEFLFQFVELLEEHYRGEGIESLELFASQSAVSLNAQPAVPLYDPNVDLTEARWSLFGHDDWVLDAR